VRFAFALALSIAMIIIIAVLESRYGWENQPWEMGENDDL
jgi:hypothetical protein